MEGHVFALDVFDGSLLWSRNLGGRVISSPITYLVDDQQHFSIVAGHSFYTFVSEGLNAFSLKSHSRPRQ